MTLQSTNTEDLFIPVAEAARIAGRPTHEAFHRWLRRSPELTIRRLHGRVHLGDLRVALNAAASTAPRTRAASNDRVLAAAAAASAASARARKGASNSTPNTNGGRA